MFGGAIRMAHAILRAMRSLSGSDTTLVIQSPTWMGVALVALGIAVTLGVLVRRWPRPVRLSALLGTILLLYGGWHLLRNVITFEPRGFYVESPLGEEERVGWLQVSGIDAGGLTGARNAEPGHLVFNLRTGRDVSVDLSGLSADEKARVLAFARSRVKR